MLNHTRHTKASVQYVTQEEDDLKTLRGDSADGPNIWSIIWIKKGMVQYMDLVQNLAFK